MSEGLRIVLLSWLPIVVIWGGPWLARVVRERLARKVARGVMIGRSFDLGSPNIEARTCHPAQRCGACQATGICPHCRGIGYTP